MAFKGEDKTETIGWIKASQILQKAGLNIHSNGLTCILGVITNLHHHRKNKIISLTPGPSDQLTSSAYTHHGPSISPLHSPSPSASRWSAPAHAPSPTTISSEFGMPIPAPTVSPLSSSIIKKATPPPSPLMALPPPPPNEECTSLSCTKVWNPIYMIALGAARGLAYLHEDCSPRVIHKDFKSSNILLELDFPPKVSDFGLARTALDEENKHISTHVMGTFGYLAPEYAMTGHLLVKSDVYSYGVVLLELQSLKKGLSI